MLLPLLRSLPLHAVQQQQQQQQQPTLRKAQTHNDDDDDWVVWKGGVRLLFTDPPLLLLAISLMWLDRSLLHGFSASTSCASECFPRDGDIAHNRSPSCTRVQHCHGDGYFQRSKRCNPPGYGPSCRGCDGRVPAALTCR